jgi:hypothetical protein
VELSTNLFNHIYSLMFVKDGEIVNLLINGHQNDVEKEKENKIQGFSKKIPASWTRLTEPGQVDQLYNLCYKVEITILSNDLRRNFE